MAVRESVEAVLRDPRIWRGDSAAPIRAEPTGFAPLDARLPGGGWPLGALSEILFDRIGVGELSCTLPLLARLTQGGRHVALVAPPAIPYAPALAAAGLHLPRTVVVDARGADALWAAEQLLQAGAGAVLLWSDKPDAQAQRRLQLGAENGAGCGLLLRHQRRLGEPSIAALRLRVERAQGAMQVEVLKCRGARPAGTVVLSV
jgi:protein ImuA